MGHRAQPAICGHWAASCMSVRLDSRPSPQAHSHSWCRTSWQQTPPQLQVQAELAHPRYCNPLHMLEVMLLELISRAPMLACLLVFHKVAVLLEVIPCAF